MKHSATLLKCPHNAKLIKKNRAHLISRYAILQILRISLKCKKKPHHPVYIYIHIYKCIINTNISWRVTGLICGTYNILEKSVELKTGIFLKLPKYPNLYICTQCCCFFLPFHNTNTTLLLTAEVNKSPAKLLPGEFSGKLNAPCSVSIYIYIGIL